MIDHSAYKEPSITGRYITQEMLEKTCFSKLPVPLIAFGNSVDGKTLYAFKIGSGHRKVLMWSQMHGNESTTTKAVWDMVNYLQSDDSLAEHILENCTLMIVPMLNPDGAKAYTRVNRNGVDLNRDAKMLTQPESKALRQLFEEFQPHYCFNLHDQRTLFSAGATDKPATVSFLSPASNEERDVTPTRETAMKIIVAMDTLLQRLIPGQVGRYDDGFNDNCVGDAFQMTGTPTILFEAGHFPGDYEREKTREYIFLALVEALRTIALDKIADFSSEDYFKIPENDKLFFDVLVKNPSALNPELDEQVVGIRYKEVLEGEKIIFEPEIVETGPLEGFYGHKNLECVDSKDFASGISDRMIVNLLLQTKK
ncbi:M14 metallopeptidase family protein [Allomuricauda taeanensis]|uniref:M14 family metallopeptidase n=1 Tax=Flagellimonas taeanensis TaxID=1005926 RepID=UPI002E7AD6DA|nr:M14 metallopeptidase family protein [Allomuricauda taeanensis]MEE1963361.1 M14 metallopeptidase family protein [Allomuricauda taeanensis]